MTMRMRSSVAPSTHVDDLSTETLDHLGRVLDAVAGNVHVHPGDANRLKRFQAAEVRLGIEVVLPRVATFGVGEGDVERRPIAARRIASRSIGVVPVSSS